jgi:hypothetical protein
MLINGGTGLYQGTTPSITLIIANNGNEDATISTPIPAWFISCTANGQTVFSSNPITALIINKQSTIQFPIKLSSIATQTIGGPFNVVCAIGTYSNWQKTIASRSVIYTVQAKPVGRFDITLDRVKQPISEKLDSPVAELWVGGIKSRAYNLIDKLAIPGAILIGIFFALLALYQIMFRPDKENLTKIKWLIIRWVVGIVIMVSAKFLGKLLYNDILYSGEVWINQLSATAIVSQVYDLLLYPFLKIFYYIAMGVLFVILLIRAFSFVSNPDEDVRKKAVQIIISTVLWLLVIIGSKQLVEWVYGREADIRSGSQITITDVGSSFLSDANIPIIYTIVQWVMGLAAFAVLAIIIFQTFKMLTDPTNEENLGNIRKTILYVVLGMFVIWAGYLIVNVLLIN